MEITTANAILRITIPSFNDEGSIPVEFTCEGDGKNPALQIDGLPPQAKCLALIVEDPDAPNGTFDHWLVWNIPPSHIISENSVPGVEGKNGRGRTGYIPPCPPKGTHRYYFKVYALDALLDLEEGADKKELQSRITRHLVGYGEIIGLYQKSKQ